jgi:alpha-mannosidase
MPFKTGEICHFSVSMNKFAGEAKLMTNFHRVLIAGFLFFAAIMAISHSALADDVSDNQQLHGLSRFYLDHLSWSQNTVAGFQKRISGEQIDYTSPWPDAPSALLVRAKKESKPVCWETGTGDHPAKRFIWMAGLGCSHAEKTFTLTIDGQDSITFTNRTLNEWSIANRHGDRLSFIAVDQDRHQDLFGFMLLELAKPRTTAVRLSVSGEPAASYSWFMIYQTAEVLTPFAKAERSGFSYTLDWSEKDGCRLTIPVSWQHKKVLWRDARNKTYEPVATSAHGTVYRLPACKLASMRWPMVLYVDGAKRDVLAGLPSLTANTVLRSDSLLILRTTKSDSGHVSVECSGLYSRLLPSLQRIEQDHAGVKYIDLMSSSHQDIAWMDSPHQCMLDRDSKVLTPALELLQKNGKFCYSAEQVLMLQEYLSLHPDAKELILALTRSGRLEWGATYNQPYEGLYSGEELVRQLYHGRIWLQKTLPGCDARVAWNVDVPGRTLQMPQILAKSGVPYMIISRHEPGLFYWSSPDGSRVGVYSPGHYHENSNFMRQPSFRIMATFPQIISDWPRFSGSGASPALPVLVSTDMGAPFDYESLRHDWNQLEIKNLDESNRSLPLPEMRYATATSFMDHVFSSRPALPTIQGERPNVWLYIHGPTHQWAIDYHRQAGQLLPAAEKFNAILASLTGTWSQYPEQELEKAWESAIYPDHGWGGKNGEITDSTFKAKYQYARDVGKLYLEQALGKISKRISRNDRNSARLVVFNDLAFARTASIEFPCDFVRGWCRDVKILNSSGRTVPHQWLTKESYDDKTLRHGELLFRAEAVPSLGYESFYIKPAKPIPDKEIALNKEVETDHYRLTLAEGGLAGIFDKELNVEIARTDKFLFGELLCMTSVGNGAGEFAEVQQPTMQDFDKVSQYKPAWRLVKNGAVAIALEMEQKLAHVLYRMTLTLYRHSKQIDFDVDLVDWDGTPYREFRLAFPLAMNDGQVSYAVPFGTVTVDEDELAKPAGERYTQPPSQVRPREVQEWISSSNGQYGATFSSSVAVWDFQDPTPEAVTYPVLQPILLASRKSCHGEGNWYLQKGSHHYHFTLRSHQPGWQNGYHAAISANTPFYPVWQDPKSDAGMEIPDQYSFLKIANPNLLLSTLKKSREQDALVMRVYEMEGKDTAMAWSFFQPVHNIEKINMVEEAGSAFWDSKVGHHAVETLRFNANK